MSPECPLCSQEASITRPNGGVDGFLVACAACGEFDISRTFFATLESIDPELRLFLSCYTRQTSEAGERPLLTTANWKTFAAKHQHQDTTVQRAKLLQLLKKRTGTLGKTAKLDLLNDHPLIDATSRETLDALLHDLERRGYVEDVTLDGACRLTVAGWEATTKPLPSQESSVSAGGPPGRRFDVAISFAGSERHVARSIAERLQVSEVSVFFDEFVAGELWGKDLVEEFGSVYLDQAQFCLMLVSKQYVERQWPAHERRHALARALNERAEYVLPVRFDSTAVPGLPPTIGYLEFDQHGVEGVCELLLKKLTATTVPSQSPSLSASTEEQNFPIHMDDLQHFADRLRGEGFDARVDLFNGQVGLIVGPRGLDRSSLPPDTLALFLPLWEINHPRNRHLVRKRDFQSIVECRPGDFKYDRPYSD